MYYQPIAMLNASRRFILCQRRCMSNSDMTIGTGTTNAPSMRWMSRRLFWQYQQYLKSKKSPSKSGPDTKLSTAKDDTPWPRNFVYGAYVAMSICIPYSLAWFLSSNAPIRSVIFPYTTYYESSFIIEWMRQHFGIPDYECIAEPEAVQLLLSNQPIPHRFVDEPTKRVRQQQLYIDQQHQRDVKFRFISGTATAMEQGHVVDLPARTLARYDHLVKVVPVDMPIQPPIALDFNEYDDDGEEETITSNDRHFSNDTVSLQSDDATTITVPAMSIYSLWHYQPPTTTEDRTNVVNPIHQMSPIDIELSRVQYEMDVLQQELKSQQQQRPIDDIQDEMVKLKSLKRQLQWRKWLAW